MELVGSQDGAATRFMLMRGGERVSMLDGLTLLQHPDVAWCSDGKYVCLALWQLLKNAVCDVGAMGGVFFEMPVVDPATIEARPFEFVLLPHVDFRPQDPAAFEGNLARKINAFRNIGGDAVLVAPSDISTNACYGHLADFMRHAPPDQCSALWRTVASEALEATKPVYISTSGLGVPWLHVRVCDVPKYYKYAPYTRADPVGVTPGTLPLAASATLVPETTSS